MVCHSSAGTCSQVHPDIDALGTQGSLNYCHGATEESHKVTKFVFGKVSELSGVTLWCDQEMAIVVGVLIQHDAGMLRNL